jgi:hypothetical protein
VILRELLLVAVYVLGFVLIVIVLAPMAAHQLSEQMFRR